MAHFLCRNQPLALLLLDFNQFMRSSVAEVNKLHFLEEQENEIVELVWNNECVCDAPC